MFKPFIIIQLVNTRTEGMFEFVFKFKSIHFEFNREHWGAGQRLVQVLHNIFVQGLNLFRIRIFFTGKKRILGRNVLGRKTTNNNAIRLMQAV